MAREKVNVLAQFEFGMLTWLVQLTRARKRNGGRYNLYVYTECDDGTVVWGEPSTINVLLLDKPLKATELEDAKLEARQVLLALAWDLEKRAKELDWGGSK